MASGGSAGASGGASGGGAGTAAIQATAPGVVRRLSRREYDNTLRDLLGDTTGPARGFLPDEQVLGFDNISAAQTVSPVLAEQYLLAAERVVSVALPALLSSLPCATATRDADCATHLLRDWGLRAWRRPLTAPELERLVGVFQTGSADGGFETGVTLALETLLISAPFLFRIERGEGAPDALGQVRVSSWEMASRLSYLLLGSLPDAELFRAAAADELKAPDQVRAQAERLLTDPRARDAVAHFHAQWLALSKIEPTHIQKDSAFFPGHSDALIHAMRRELELFVDDAFWSPGSGLAALLTGSTSFIDTTLAPIYGVPAPAGAEFSRVLLDAGQRPGLLTRAGLLALLAHPDGTSPTKRGKFVRSQLLCQTLPPPPPDVEAALPAVDPSLTTRERVSEHKNNPVCSGCHELIDPIGLGLEQYDGLGRFRTEEAGRLVDASGALLGAEVEPAEFVGAVELAHKLASSDLVRGCIATQWFRYAYGREETTADAGTLAQLETALVQSGDDFRKLLLELSQTPAFLYRINEGAAP